MSKLNTLIKYIVNVKEATDLTSDVVSEVPELLYSYALYTINKEGKTYFKLEMFVSINEEYNKIDKTSMLISAQCKIVLATKQSESKTLLSFSQPPIEIIMDAYEPLVKNLARQQYQAWSKKYELEDLEQICRLVILILYNGGYRLHKQLIIKSYNNYILSSLRKEKHITAILSFEDKIQNSKEENLYIKDVLPDKQYQEQMDDNEDLEELHYLLNICKNIVIKELGERNYQELIRCYNNGHTTNWSRKTVFNLKRKLKNKGITLKYLRRKNDGQT